jgi:hypothetical protein
MTATFGWIGWALAFVQLAVVLLYRWSWFQMRASLSIQGTHIQSLLRLVPTEKRPVCEVCHEWALVGVYHYATQRNAAATAHLLCGICARARIPEQLDGY